MYLFSPSSLSCLSSTEIETQNHVVRDGLCKAADGLIRMTGAGLWPIRQERSTELDLIERMEQLRTEAGHALSKLAGEEDLERFHHDFLGKKGGLTEAMKSLGGLEPNARKAAGAKAHEVRTEIESGFASARSRIQSAALEKRLQSERIDAMRPAVETQGRLHPLTRITRELEDLFSFMGFTILDGPEVETDANNFGKLNFSDDHPARDMQDTIWTEGDALMRTHTSSVQVRAMQLFEPPFRIVAPGRCFRFEETDASHENTFYQAEGMMVDRGLSVANLIHVMKTFLSSFFERDVNVRLRPGYFPFVEPGFELDIQCLVCGGPGCPVCKHSGWVELLPCGMVHPGVLAAGGLDPDEWTGFAFGLGLSRLVMMRYGIEDIRHFLSGNMRFLEQF